MLLTPCLTTQPDTSTCRESLLSFRQMTLFFKSFLFSFFFFLRGIIVGELDCRIWRVIRGNLNWYEIPFFSSFEEGRILIIVEFFYNLF